MIAPRHLTAARRTVLLVLVACALAIRAMVPAGWMPMAQADGVTRLILCPGSGSGGGSGGGNGGGNGGGGESAMAGMTMTPAHADGHRDPAAPAAEHDCPFAVTALAIDLAEPIAPPIAIPSAPATSVVVSPTALPGRGLAAPPPPATGPPLIA